MSKTVFMASIIDAVAGFFSTSNIIAGTGLMRFLQLSVMIGALFLGSVFAAEGRGELITVAFSGTVTDVTVRNRPELQGVDFPDVGDPFTGVYKFDSMAHDTASSVQQGSFKTVLPSNAVQVSIGNFHFEGPASIIVAFRNYYEAGSWLPPIELTSHPTLAEYLNRLSFSLTILKDDLFPDPNVLPSIPPLLAGAEGRNLNMLLDSSDDLTPGSLVGISARLDSLRVVPEPSGLILMALGLSVMLRIRTSTQPQEPAGPSPKLPQTTRHPTYVPGPPLK